jgi:hypothetical protein
MGRFRQFFLLALLAVVLGAASGCKQAVMFPPHAPYSSRFRVDEPLLVVVPNGLAAQTKSQKFGVMVIQDRYIIHYGQAFTVESEARFRPMFSSYALMDAAEYDLVMGDQVVAEAERLKAEGQPDEIVQRMYDLDFAPDFIREGEGYLLRVTRLDYLMTNSRPSFYFEADYIDRATGKVLDSYKMRTRGRETMEGQDAGTNSKRIRETTTSAISQLLAELQARLAEHHP